MAELSELDIFLAYHAPDVLELQGSRMTYKAVLATAAIGGLVLMMVVYFGLLAVVTVFHFSIPTAYLLFVVFFFVIIFMEAMKRRATPKALQGDTPGGKYLKQVYHTVYGIYGWNRPGGSHRDEAPTPIRKSEDMVHPAAFRLANAAAKQYNRISNALPDAKVSGALRDDILRETNAAMLAIFDKASRLNPNPSGPRKMSISHVFFHPTELLRGKRPESEDDGDDGRVLVQQLQEVGDRLEGRQKGPKAPTGQTTTGLETTLISLRAEQAARVELNG